MKYAFGLALIVGVWACSVLGLGGLGRSDSFDYTWGAKLATSTLIAREIVYNSKSLLQSSTKTYTLNQAGTAKTIDFISVTNLKKIRGATAEITSGGVGSTMLSVKFTSPRGGAIKSQIEVWGT